MLIGQSTKIKQEVGFGDRDVYPTYLITLRRFIQVLFPVVKSPLYKLYTCT